MTRKLLWMLAITSTFSAGNVYYAQPLLGDLTRSFEVTTADAALIPILSQCGYVIGLIFLTPLGDILEKRRLILSLLVLQTITLFTAAMTARFFFFELVACFIGLSSVLVQIIFPFVASLSVGRERSKNLGILLGSALVGILLSRAISGIIASHFGWRAVYWIAGTSLLSLTTVLFFFLPKHEPATRLSYPRLIYSLIEMTRDLPALRAVAINGALLYGALSAFWASLIFYLESDVFQLGAQAAGAFGFIGALGAAAASVVAGPIERYGSKRVIQACMLLMSSAFIVMAYFGKSYLGLMSGVVLLDIGAQAGTVTNQSELYAISHSGQTRLNTIYKVIYFVGGVSGSAGSAIAWQHFGWMGVCGVGFSFVVAAAVWEQVKGKQRVILKRRTYD